MATKTPAAKKSTSTAIARWDEELARQAAAAAAVEESTATGQFFSLKGGQLTFNDMPLPGNQMAVVILDGILENVKYEGDYDPDNVQSPTCFAFGRVEKEMQPHKIVIESGNSLAGASGQCAGCDHNQWGSADKGRGKSCRNTRRLAMVPAGTFDDRGRFEPFEDEDQTASAAIAYMRLPVTSVTGYAAFVKQVTGALKRPPHTIFTKVSVMPDPKNQFRVNFEPIAKVPDSLIETLMARHEEAKGAIDFPYSLPEDEAPAQKRGKPAPARGKAAAPAPAAKPARGKRY